MDVRIQIVAIAGAGLLLFIVLELVRRRRLLERYALLWLAAGVVLLFLSAWRDGLNVVADALGIGLARRRPVPQPGDPAPVVAGHGI